MILEKLKLACFTFHKILVKKIIKNNNNNNKINKSTTAQFPFKSWATNCRQIRSNYNTEILEYWKQRNCIDNKIVNSERKNVLLTKS